MGKENKKMGIPNYQSKRETLKTYKSMMLFVACNRLSNFDEYIEERRTVSLPTVKGDTVKNEVVYKEFTDGLIQLFVHDDKGREVIKVSTTESVKTEYIDDPDITTITRYMYDDMLILHRIHDMIYDTKSGRLLFETIKYEDNSHINKYNNDGDMIESCHVQQGFIDDMRSFDKLNRMRFI